jgi:hypothetical protein
MTCSSFLQLVSNIAGYTPAYADEMVIRNAIKKHARSAIKTAASVPVKTVLSNMVLSFPPQVAN